MHRSRRSGHRGIVGASYRIAITGVRLPPPIDCLTCGLQQTFDIGHSCSLAPEGSYKAIACSRDEPTISFVVRKASFRELHRYRYVKPASPVDTIEIEAGIDHPPSRLRPTWPIVEVAEFSPACTRSRSGWPAGIGTNVGLVGSVRSNVHCSDELVELDADRRSVALHAPWNSASNSLMPEPAEPGSWRVRDFGGCFRLVALLPAFLPRFRTGLMYFARLAADVRAEVTEFAHRPRWPCL